MRAVGYEARLDRRGTQAQSQLQRLGRERRAKRKASLNEWPGSGGEDKEVPSDAVSLFMYRVKKSAKGGPAWIPQIRFAEGNYAMAFSFED